MGSLSLSIAGADSETKTLLIYSNTTSEQLFTATWSIGDSLYNDAPTTNTDWTSFKSTYVTEGTGINNINIDLAKWALDNGSVFGGDLHSFTVSSFCNSSTCQSNLDSNTINVEAKDPHVAKTYVIIASGESTMVGRANDKTTPPDTTDTRITQWGRISPNDGVEILADDPLQHNDSAQAGNSIGVSMSYARALLPTLHASDKIIIVPVARGGSGYYNNEQGIGNVLYTDTVSRVNAVIALDPSNTVLKLITAIGINDGFYNNATFQAEFDADDANYRNDFTGDQSQMMHLVLGIIPAWNDGAGIDEAHDALKTSGNRLFNTTYVQWDDGTPISAGDKHPDGASNRTMGARLQTFDAAFVPVAPSAPANAPANLSLVVGNDSLDVSFDAVNYATSYVVQYKLSVDSSYSQVITSSTNILIGSLTGGSQYDVRVISRNDIGDSSPSSVVTGTPTSAPSSVREPNATIHHFFGTDYSTFEDIQGGGALTPAGTSPTNGSGFLTTATGMNGLRSAVNQTSTQTIIAVVKPVNSAGNAILLGNLNTSTGGGGASMFEAGDDMWVATRGGAGSAVIKTNIDYTDYLFIAMSLNNSAQLGYYKDTTQQNAITSVLSGGVNSPTPVRTIGVGNTEYTATSFNTGCEIAEFIVFPTALPISELDAVYARSVTRLGARGITV